MVFSHRLYQYGFHMTSAELAAAVGLSVVQIEAMTEDEVKALMLENKHILNLASYEGKAVAGLAL
jgi:hypothetical protein